MKRYILILVAAVIASLSFAQNPQGLFVYRHDGSLDVFHLADIDSIKYSPIDMNGNLQEEMVTQEFWTENQAYRIPLATIDSVSFSYPDATFNKHDGQLNVMNTESFRFYVWDYKAHPEELIFKSDRPVVVDYWAKWCVYCRQMMPLLQQLAQEYKGKVDFYKIDTDREVDLSNFLGISSLPCLYFYPKKGKPVVRVGAMDLASMRDIIEKVLLIVDDENPDAPKPALSVEAWKGDQMKEWTDRKITTRIQCATANATLMKFGCFLKSDWENSGLTARELVQQSGSVLEESQLAKLNSPEGITMTFPAKKGKTYVMIAMVKNAEGGITVEQTEVTTDAQYVPVLELQLQRGALEEYLQPQQQYFTFYLKGLDVVKASYLYLKKSDYEAALSQGKTSASLLEQQGTVLTQDKLALINGIGYSVVVGGLEEMTDYICLATATDVKGKTSTMSGEITTAFAGYSQVIPSPDVNIIANLYGNSVSCSVNSTTSDAIATSLLMLPSEELTQLLASGKTLEEIMDTHPKVSVFSAQQLEWMNGQGVSNVYNGLTPSTRYSWVVDVKGRWGGRCVKRTEIQTWKEGEQAATLDFSLSAYYNQGMLTASATCQTANAKSAVLAFIESDKLEQLLNAGNTLESLMEHPADDFITCDTFTADQIQWFNQSGFVLGNSNFKANTRYTYILDVHAVDGQRLVKRTEVLTPKNIGR